MVTGRQRISRGKLIALNAVLLLFMLGAMGTMFAVMLPPALEKSRDDVWRMICRSHLKDLHGAFVQYSGSNDGALPPIPNGLEFLMASLPEARLIDYQCPAAGPMSEDTDDDVAFTGSEYVYLGYELRGQDDLDMLAAAYVQCHGDDQAIAALGPISGAQRSVALLRADLKDPSRVPLLVEKGLNHIPDGGHVLYLDGHVEYVTLGEKFPMTTAFFDRVSEMENSWQAGHIPPK